MPQTSPADVPAPLAPAHRDAASSHSALSSRPRRRTSDAIVALVGDQPITAQQLRRALTQEQAEGPHRAEPERRTRALERLIDEILAEQVAAQRGLEVSNEDVELALAMLGAELGQHDSAALQAMAGSLGWSLQALRWELRRKLLGQALLKEALAIVGGVADAPRATEGDKGNEAEEALEGEAERLLAAWLATHRRTLRIQYWPGRVDELCGS
ncbi:MAG: SurA N-terminal domain-containing protein [Comamonas sp.]